MLTIKKLPKIDITEDERKWLLECWNHLITQNSIAKYRQIRIKTHKSISKDFKPWNIDSRLIRENVEITLKGVIALGLEEEIFKIGNKVFQYIRNELFEDVDKENFDLNFIAECIEEDRKRVKIIFKLLSNEGYSLWSGASSKTDEYGYDSISIGKHSLETYLNYNSIEEAFISDQKSILEYQKNQKNIIIPENTDFIFGDNNFKNTSNTLFPLEILNNSRGYIVNIGHQASECYNSELYDACLVMVIKLLETLIIECFERYSVEEKIKGKDNHYYYLNDLINKFLIEDKWSINRNTSKSLPKIKSLGDLSAHNRRFSAKRGDIDNIRIDLRIIIEDLIHLIDYPNWNKN